MEFPLSGVRAVLHSDDGNCSSCERINIESVECEPTDQCELDGPYRKRIVCPTGTLNQFVDNYFRDDQKVAVFQWFLGSGCTGPRGLELVVPNGVCNQGIFQVDFVSDTQVRYRRFGAENCVGDPVFDYVYTASDIDDVRCVAGDLFSLTLYSMSWVPSATRRPTSPPQAAPMNTPSENPLATPMSTPSESPLEEPSSTINPAASTSSNSTLSVVMGVLGAAAFVAIALGTLVWKRYRTKDINEGPLIETTSTRTKGTDQVFHITKDTSGIENMEDEFVHDTAFCSDRNSFFEKTHELTRRIAVQDLEYIRQLGVGGHAVVRLVLYQKTKLLASKRLLARGDSRQQKRFIDEICLSASLVHPQIVQLYGVAWTQKADLQALFEFMEGGDLRSWLKRTRDSAEHLWTETKLQIAKDVAAALVYVHSRQPPIVHRDLKSRNVLLTASLRAKLCDFGISRAVTGEENTMTAGVGTMQWMAPEVICGERLYDQRADMYSFGVLLAEMDSHAVPYADAQNESGGKLDRIALLHQVLCGSRTPSFSSTCPATILTLARQCLSVDPIQRPSAQAAVAVLEAIMK